MKAKSIPEPGPRGDAQFIESLFHSEMDWRRSPTHVGRLAEKISWRLNEIESSRFAGEDLIKSVRDRGVSEPLVMHGKYLEGNHRFAAAFALKLVTIPVYKGEVCPIIKYHVFSDRVDDWFDSHEFEKANRLYETWKRQYGRARLYKETYADFDAIDADECEEDCILSHGPYPI